mgnify:CR=1 FL=1
MLPHQGSWILIDAHTKTLSTDAELRRCALGKERTNIINTYLAASFFASFVARNVGRQSS